MDRNSPAGKAIWRLAKACVVITILAGVLYFFRFAPVPVRQHRVERGNLITSVLGTGTLEARVKATISPKISGRLEQVSVDQGDQVKVGQILATLDSRDLEQQVAIAEAGIAAAHAGVDLVEADAVRARAVLDQARRDYQRLSNLTSAQVATSADLEKITESLAVAEAGLGRSQAAIVEARKQVVSAEKTLEFQRARLADALLPAPFDGLVVRRQRDPGDVVVPGGAVLTLISTEEMWISAWVDETQMPRLAPGQKANIVFRSEPDKAYEGVVARLGREADRETREFIVDVQAKELPVNWAVGQRAEVHIETGEKEGCITLPSEWVLWREREAGVFVSHSSRVRWQPLTLGRRGRDVVEVVEGLTPGDLVIRPLHSTAKPLVEGRKVIAQ